MNAVIPKKRYDQITSPSEYKKYLNDVKQEAHLLRQINANDTDLEKYLSSTHGIEDDIIWIIKSYYLNEHNQNPLVHTDDELLLTRLFYKQYRLFGRSPFSEGYLKPNLVIFKYQHDQISALIEEFVEEGHINLEDEKFKEFHHMMDQLKQNLYPSYSAFKEAFFSSFQVSLKRDISGRASIKYPSEHDFGSFLDGSMKWGGVMQKPIAVFMARMRLILIGGEYIPEKERYMPFFMEREDIQEDIRFYLNALLEDIIGEYFPKLNTPPNIRPVLKTAKKYEYLLENPPITIKLFEIIDWDFMPEVGFYDGGFLPKEDRAGDEKVARSYIINLHPLPLFYCYFNRAKFGIFIKHLLYHEFTHVLQILYGRVHDLVTQKDSPFKTASEKNYFLRKAKLRLVEEKKDPQFKTMMDYIIAHGGHTPMFMKQMARFKERDLGLVLRGKLSSIYESLFWRLYGRRMGIEKGKWYL